MKDAPIKEFPDDVEAARIALVVDETMTEDIDFIKGKLGDLERIMTNINRCIDSGFDMFSKKFDDVLERLAEHDERFDKITEMLHDIRKRLP